MAVKQFTSFSYRPSTLSRLPEELDKRADIFRLRGYRDLVDPFDPVALIP